MQFRAFCVFYHCFLSPGTDRIVQNGRGDLWQFNGAMLTLYFFSTGINSCATKQIFLSSSLCRDEHTQAVQLAINKLGNLQENFLKMK